MIISIQDATDEQRESAVQQMELALVKNNTAYMEYIAGTLGICFSDDLCISVNISDHEELRPEESRAAAKLYLQYKTENHCYYALAQELVS